MKKALVVFSVFFVILGLLLYLYSTKKISLVSPIGRTQQLKEMPLEKYTFENLRKKSFDASKIKIGELLKTGDGFRSYVFYFNVFDQSSNSYKKVSGMVNMPGKEGTYPIIVMNRGYIDREKYTIGEGTRHSGEVFAQNGFITLAPDFLGYGESDKPSVNSIEERFQTYTTALTLLASVKNLNKGLDQQCYSESFSSPSPSLSRQGRGKFPLPSAGEGQGEGVGCENDIKADPERIGIWGHSNGGHISLSILAITGKSYPTVLWNPVSKPFPYSVLYFTDGFDDNGKALRFAIANFEKDYDIEKYSPTNYYNWINAPIQLHQAIEDEAVPVEWSDQLDEKLEELEKDVTYFTYPGENHNFGNGGWATAIQRSINFYREQLGK